MDARLTQLARRNDGLVLLRQARSAGVPDAATRWAVSRGDLHRIARGGFVIRDAWESAPPRRQHLLRLRSALDRAPGAVAAAESAAVVWGLPLPGRPPVLPVLLRPRTTARPEPGQRGAATLRRAWLHPDEVERHAGIPVTTLSRTFVDLARAMSLPWSLAVADEVRRRTGFSADQLCAAVARHPCAPGHDRTLRVAALSQHLVESPLESVCRGVQVELGLPVPDVQVWVGRDRPEHRVDMLVREHATVVEADGRLKYDGTATGAEAVWDEKRRTDRLLDLGYDCYRFVASDHRRPYAWGRGLLEVFARSHRRRAEPVPVFDLPWA